MNIFRWFRRRRFGLGEYSRFSNTFRSRGDRVTSRDQTVLRAGLAAARVKFTADREAADAVRSLPGRISRLRDKAFDRSLAAGRVVSSAINVGRVLGLLAVVAVGVKWAPALLQFVWSLITGLAEIAVAIFWAFMGALGALLPFLGWALVAIAAGFVLYRAARGMGVVFSALLKRRSASAASAASTIERELVEVERLDRELNGSSFDC